MDYLKAPISQTRQTRPIWVALVVVVLVAIVFMLAGCTADPIWLTGEEVCVDLIVGPGAVDSIAAVVPADSFRVMADGTVVRFVPCP